MTSPKQVGMLVPKPPGTAESTAKPGLGGMLSTTNTSRSHVSERTSVGKNPAGANLFSRYMKTSTSANVRAPHPLDEHQRPVDASPRRQIGILCRNIPPTEQAEVLNLVVPSIRCAKDSDDRTTQQECLSGNAVYDYSKARKKLTRSELMESVRPLVAITFFEQNPKLGTRGKDFNRLVVPNQVDIRNTLTAQTAMFSHSVCNKGGAGSRGNDEDEWDRDSEKEAPSPAKETGRGRVSIKDKIPVEAIGNESGRKAHDPEQCACVTCRFVQQQLGQFESNVFGKGRATSSSPRGQGSRRKAPAPQDGAAAPTGAPVALDYLCAIPFAASAPAGQPGSQLVQQLATFQQVCQSLDERTPAQRLLLRQSILTHFPNLFADAMELRGRPTIHVAEYLSLFLTPAVIPFRSDVPVPPSSQYFRLPSRPSFSVHHIGRLAQGHPVPAEDNYLVPQVQVRQAVLDSVHPWEGIFLLHDAGKSGRANKHLLLLNIIAATADSVIMEPEDLKHLSRDISRARAAVAWLVALLLLRPAADTVRAGELFAIRDFMRSEIDRDKRDRQIIYEAYFGSKTVADSSLRSSSKRSTCVATRSEGSTTPRMKPTAHFFPPTRFENALQQLEEATRQMIEAREQLPPASAASLLQECFFLQPS